MSISIKNFRVEYADSPIGVVNTAPRFSWEIESDEKNVKQEGYSIKVTGWIDYLMWDTGYVESDENVNITYKGRGFERDNLYSVKLTVRVNGKDYTANTEFRTGLMGYRPAHVAWINADLNEPEARNAPYFRREFALKSDEVAFATAYVADCGWSKLYLNGERVDKDQMLSMTLGGDDQSAIRSHDITKVLKPGMNAFGVALGSGFSQHFRPSGHLGSKRFWALISITFTDGSYQHIWTDESWKWHRSPVIMNHIYDGEWYDARLSLPGWNKPGFNDADWANAVRSTLCNKLVDSYGPAVKILGTRPVAKINKIGENTYIYDFKYNGSGVVKIKVKGDPGAEVIMHHAENLHDDGTLQPWTNRNAEATDRYILKGEGEEVYAPSFTYHGFRYVEFTLKGNVEVLEAEALVIGSDMFGDSHFDCSDSLITRIQENFIRTLKTNFMSWPADTGVRDERTSCTMDSLVYEEMAMHNCSLSLRNYYENWCHKNYAKYGRPDWDGELIVLPWLMNKYYGDKEFVKTWYPKLFNLANSFYYNHIGDWKEKNFEKGFGDWTAPSATNDYEDSFSSVIETNYAMWYLEMYILRDMAKLVGAEEDIPQIEKYMETAKEYYLENFYNPETHLFSEGKQTPNLLAIVADGILSEDEKQKVLKALVKSIREKDNSHLDTGIFGTRLLIDALSISEEGLELVYDILTQTTYPSYGRQIVGKDATTAWEQWYNQQGMMTCSHSMYTGIGVDFYKKFAGITTLENCFKKALIKPIAPSKITYVNCTLNTIRGNYTVNWVRDGGKMKLNVTVPANCEAVVEMPDGTRHEIGSGSYEF